MSALHIPESGYRINHRVVTTAFEQPHSSTTSRATINNTLHQIFLNPYSYR